MKDNEKAINLIKYLIREHENEGLCIELSEAEKQIPLSSELVINKIYELGRYETLVDLLNTLERMEK